MTRFDPWANRPDGRRRRRRPLSRGRRDALVWLAILAVLMLGYAWRDRLADVWNAVATATGIG